MRKQKKKNGMTLIEVIIAIAIVGIIALGTLQMFTMSVFVISNAGKKTQSAYDTQSHVENTLNVNYIDAPEVDEELVLTIGGTQIIAPGRKIEMDSQLGNGENVVIEIFQPKH